MYRVLDEKNNLFAIKKVDISKNDAESRASFINEIHLLEKLRGKGQIIRLVDSEINDTKKVLLMVSLLCSLLFVLSARSRADLAASLAHDRSWKSARRTSTTS